MTEEGKTLHPPSTSFQYWSDLEDGDATAPVSVVVNNLQAVPPLSLQPHALPPWPQSHPVPLPLTLLQAGLQGEAPGQDKLGVLLPGGLNTTTTQC